MNEVNFEEPSHGFSSLLSSVVLMIARSSIRRNDVAYSTAQACVNGMFARENSFTRGDAKATKATRVIFHDLLVSFVSSGNRAV